MFSTFNKSRKWFYILYGAMFTIMLVSNILTPMIADDYLYSFGFHGNLERIDSVGDIIPSLVAHGEQLNGRYAAHFFAHLFLMMPGWIFDIVNACVFVSIVFIIHKIATYKKERNNMISLFLFGMLWLCQCQFGQVNLWLDGACNYLWSIFFGLVFVAPYIMYLLYDVTLSLPLTIPFLIIALLSGNFMENTSPVFIFVAGLCVVASKYIFKKKLRCEQILGILASIVGFVFMMIAPAEWRNKATNGSFSTIFINFGTAVGVVALMAVPLTMFTVLILRARKDEAKKPMCVVALILMLGALASNFMMVIAAYYALRSTIGFISLTLFAVTLLLSQESFEFKKTFKIISSVLVASFVFAISIGLADITRSFVLLKRNEDIMISAKENGEMVVGIPDVEPITRFSCCYRIIYVNEENPYNWPNDVMAKYYGLDCVYHDSGK